jgi:tetratricopeptide (TPR) repeat protein
MTYAQYLGKLGRVAEAVALLRHAFDCNPGDPVGAALFFQYSPDEFLSIGLGDDYFRDMLQAYRLNRPPVFYRLSALLSRYCPDVLSRIEAEMGALMRYPSHQAEFAFHLGNLLLAEGDISGAERHLGHAVDLDPSNPALQRALKSVHAQQGTYPAAARAPAGYAPANVGLTA